jgi:hypothetical protein
MKTIIISDIKSKEPSIIPYGLHLASAMGSEADIIHVIDSRTTQGVPSSYADSHTVSPGGKQSHDQIIEKEILLTRDSLSQLISREVSRLNYPLKVNTVVEENSIEIKLKDFTKTSNNRPVILIASSEPDGHIFESIHEILKILKKSDAVTVLVPPGEEFNSFDNILMVTDFSRDEFEKHKKIFSLLGRNNHVIKALATPDVNKEIMTEKSNTWKEYARKLMPGSDIIIATSDENSLDSLLDRIEDDDPDILVNVRDKQSFIDKLLGNKKFERNLVSAVRRPVMIDGN